MQPLASLPASARRARNPLPFGAPLPVTALLASAGALAAVPAPAQAQINRCQDAQNNEVPCLRFNIPTVKFTQITRTPDGGIERINVPFIGEYVNGIYTYALGAGLTVAAVIAVVGGFEWLVAGDSGRVAKAKERIYNAVVSLVLLLFAYALLNTVDPALTKFSGLNVNVVRGQPFTEEQREDYGDSPDAPTDDIVDGTAAPAPTTKPSGEKAYCVNPDDCRKKCEDPSAWPKTWPGVMADSQKVTIPDSKGLKGGGQTSSAEMVEALKRAGAYAASLNPPMYIVVSSGFRSFTEQMRIVCDSYIGHGAAEEAKIGSSVAWPGRSNHGNGKAVDIQLWDATTKKQLVASGGCANQAAGKSGTAANVKKFEEIMFHVGFRRYEREVWHFEYNAGTECRCGIDRPCPTYPNRCKAECLYKN
jgi:hypothetical protein